MTSGTGGVYNKRKKQKESEGNNMRNLYLAVKHEAHEYQADHGYTMSELWDIIWNAVKGNKEAKWWWETVIQDYEDDHRCKDTHEYMIRRYKIMDDYDGEVVDSGLKCACAKSIVRHLNKLNDGWHYYCAVQPDRYV